MIRSELVLVIEIILLKLIFFHPYLSLSLFLHRSSYLYICMCETVVSFVLFHV